MRVCLIGFLHPCNNPRLVREAEVLVEAGHDVRVVTPSFTPEWYEADQRLAATGGWSLDTVDWRPIGLRGKIRSLCIRGRRRLAAEMPWLHGMKSIAFRAYISGLPELQRLAASTQADWYIAHHHGALPVAAAAARRWQARLGFDMEDLLAESDCGDPPHLVRLIERLYLPQCDYVSVPSQCLGEHLAQTYGALPLLVLYNVPRICAAEGMTPPGKRPASPIIRVHWIGQTIGPRRGIEDAVAAVGLLKQGVELHLRGRVKPGYDDALLALARQAGVADVVVLHDRVQPEAVVQAMQEFHVGLAFQFPKDVNADLAASNKLFAYMLGGLAVAATDTVGQREVLEKAPRAGSLFPSGKPEILAEGLKRWMESPTALREAQQAAWSAARQRFCWEVEKDKYLKTLEDGLRTAGPRFPALHST